MIKKSLCFGNSMGTAEEYVVAVCGSLFVASEARECLYM